MRNLSDIERFRGIMVIKRYEDIEVSDFYNIDLIVFLVDEERDVKKAHGLKRENTLIIECCNYMDKVIKAESIINFIDINLPSMKYSYIRNETKIIINK